ncbi:MAG: glycosyltransferase, partial [Candidatus Firestonebacteria bacterium]
MKICVLGDAQSVHNKKWCENIAGLGHEVWLITLHKPSKIPGVRVVSFYSLWSRYLDIAFKIKKRKIQSLI